MSLTTLLIVVVVLVLLFGGGTWGSRQWGPGYGWGGSIVAIILLLVVLRVLGLI